ncbi:MAG: bifunctional glutamate N-acetyltransferase/amino-acid acetyltransferase ArgJ [Planctomycetota bacterium]
MTLIKLPLGFRYAGVACGIKPSGKPDLSLVVADDPVVAAGVYTQNQVVAAPVVWCRNRTPSSSIRAVVTNSGNANACTGDQGDSNAAEMCELSAKLVGCRDDDVLVMSTGVIGQQLPMERVRSGIEKAASKLGRQSEHFDASADAILTTDVARKCIVENRELDGETAAIAAMAKGAGMVAPNMATMLACITTDVKIEPELAAKILKRVAEASFNRVSVDGHTSTNDTMLLLASGKSNVEIHDGNLEAFESWLSDICLKLAIELVVDGEGASHVMHIQVDGANDHAQATAIARAVGESPLVKTAIAGGDPNWGRIVSAAGNANSKVEPRFTSLQVAGTELYRAGVPTDFDVSQVSKAMRAERVIKLKLTVGEGEGVAEHWASDLTVDYVKFNSEYTT